MEDDTEKQKRSLDICTEEVNTVKKLRASEPEISESLIQTACPSPQSLNLITDTVPKKELLSNVTELDVGISQYINDLPGFTAVIKERYSDFLVNEINPDGELVRLTSMEKPIEVLPTVNSIDVEIQEQIKELVENKESSKPVVIEVTHKDKSSRKSIHEAIRHYYQGLDSSTENQGEKKVIIIKRDAKCKNRRFRPVSQGNYIQFVLYKENRDTMDAINTLSSFLNIQSKRFSYAGTKDKRAKTSQLASVHGVPVNKLLKINEKFNMIKVGNIVYKKEQMRLGQLLGNHFVVILRRLQGNKDLIAKSVASLQERGFINYYGMQRFGTQSVATHSIGRSLLLGEWKNAINLILKPRAGDENSNLAESRKIWAETGDARKAYKNLHHKSSIEGKLLDGLSVHNENDYVNALNAIPRNTRLMYIHSYQSYVWNQAVSRRMKKFGMNVIIGDLVSESKDEISNEFADIPETVTNQEKKIPTEMKEITEENISQYTIHDVFLPLPGHNIKYPNNETKEWYDEILKEDGMNLTNFESRVRTYSLSGSYRKVVVIPTEVKWEVIPYSDVSLPLALSDLDIFDGHTLAEPPSDSVHQALKLELNLPSSSYATMAIREIMKSDTGYSSRKQPVTDNVDN